MEYLSEQNFKSISNRIDRFFGFCFMILSENDINVKTEREILDLVNDMNTKEHKDMFIATYDDFREDILKGHKSTDWLIGSEVMLVIDNIEFELNLVYNSCCKVSNANSKLIKKYKNASVEKRYETFYPKIFLFLLYSCFECFCPKEDREQIRLITTEVKTFIQNLGEEPTASKSAGGLDFGGGFGEVLDGVFTMFSQNPKLKAMVSKSKIPVDSIIKDVSGALKESGSSDISTVINAIINKIPINEYMNGGSEEEPEETESTAATSPKQQLVVTEPGSNDAPEVFDL